MRKARGLNSPLIIFLHLNVSNPNGHVIITTGMGKEDSPIDIFGTFQI